MTDIKQMSKTSDGLISELDLGDFKASWVGEFTLGQGVACGAEDGRIQLISKDGKTIRGTTETDEAINGLAFLPNWMGVARAMRFDLWIWREENLSRFDMVDME